MKNTRWILSRAPCSWHRDQRLLAAGRLMRAAVTAPAETAEAFVARANAPSCLSISREGSALPSWVRATYITGDTAIIAASGERASTRRGTVRHGAAGTCL